MLGFRSRRARLPLRRGGLQEQPQLLMRVAAENRRRCPLPVSKAEAAGQLGVMAARTAAQRRRRAETERRRYTIKRVAVLRALLPELVDDALATCALRQLSVAVRRSGVGQGTLAAFRQVESSSGPLSKEQPLCAELTAADARSAP